MGLWDAAVCYVSATARNGRRGFPDSGQKLHISSTGFLLAFPLLLCGCKVTCTGRVAWCGTWEHSGAEPAYTLVMELKAGQRIRLDAGMTL
jgi:hypothetical protein